MMHPRPTQDEQSSNAGEPQRYFFLHLQKTAGVSLRQHLIANLGRDKIYPPKKVGDKGFSDFLIAYMSGALLTSLPDWAQRQYTLFHGHMPFCVTRRLCFERPLKTFTILRDPVERTISVLGQKKRHRPEYHDASLEDIYDDPKVFPGQILNHQAKTFAIPDDCGKELLGGYAPYTVGPEELERAKDNLATVDVVGLLDDMPGFLEDLSATFGWTMLDEDVRENVGRKIEVSDELLERIRTDNAMELEFYAFAQQLVRERNAARRIAVDA